VRAFIQQTHKRRKSAPNEYALTFKREEVASADLAKHKAKDGKPRFSEPNRPLRFASDKKITSYSMMRKTSDEEDNDSDDKLISSRPNSKGIASLNKSLPYQPVL
jgi:hypothetical protein